MFRSNNEVLTAKLEQIPPSATHLFDEEHLEAFLNKQGGFFQSFDLPESRYRHRKNTEAPITHSLSQHSNKDQGLLEQRREAHIFRLHQWGATLKAKTK
nr:unnamed protein product [Callosobruchus analis]